MTLVARHPPPAGTPQTHALVVGVSSYPFLKSGPGATLGLGDLDAPVPSATAFANFLLDEYDHPNAPLATVELLLSGGAFAVSDGSTQAVPEPTFANIKSAFNQWYDRCDASPDNVAVFYFCGHGVDPGTMTLLCQDFGSDPHALWDQAIDFDTTYYGMTDNAAVTQCYFIDACREKPLETLSEKSFRPRPLRMTPTLRGKGRAAPVFKSAIEGRQAHAPKGGGVSFFTDGVLRCFRSVAADYNDGERWVVTTDSLVTLLRKVMQRTIVKNKPALCTVHGDFNISKDLHVMPGPPAVLATIEVSPDAAHAAAAVSLVDGTRSIDRPTPLANPWHLEVAYGQYDVVATFPPGAGYQSATLPGQLAYPPGFHKILRPKP